MNDMIVPEEIYFMTPAMNPITLEIDDKETNNINENSSFNMDQCNVVDKPAICNYCNGDPQYILYNIRHTTTETWNTVQAADNVQSFSPFNNFFDKKKEKKKWNSDVQEFTVGFKHMQIVAVKLRFFFTEIFLRQF